MLTFDSTKSEYGVMGYDESNHLSLIDDAGETRDDIQLPPDEELATKIKEAVDAGEKEVFVEVLFALNQSQVMAYKTKDFEDK